MLLPEAEIRQTDKQRENEMTNADLAQKITERFTPLAFLCECKGEHPDCTEALNSASAWAQNDTVGRIVRFIKSLDEEVVAP